MKQSTTRKIASAIRRTYWYLLWATLLAGVQHYTGHWCIALAAVAAVSLITFDRSRA